MRVILDVFSGRPNPTWELVGREASQMVERVAGRTVARALDAPPSLGYRGFIVLTNTDDDEARAAGVPDVFRVGMPPGEREPGEMRATEEARETRGAGRARPAESALTLDEDTETATRLLHTAQWAIGDPLGSFVERSIGTRTAARSPGAARARSFRLQSCAVLNAPYRPDYWNRSSVMPFNNCYNYAMNYRSDTFAQPGRISGQQVSIFRCADTVAAASRDGCWPVCVGPAREVALVMWPGFDFHWYRNHTDGFWGHKVGPTPATNLDSSGQVIGGVLSPENCDRGPYVDFCGYMFPPLGLFVV